MSPTDEHWLDDEPGPVLRPYVPVRGRTRADGETLDLMAVAWAVRHSAVDTAELEPEHLAVLRLCAVPASVADLAASMDLPLGVVRVLLADLRDQGLVVVHPPQPERLTDPVIFQEVADALRRL